MTYHFTHLANGPYEKNTCLWLDYAWLAITNQYWRMKVVRVTQYWSNAPERSLNVGWRYATARFAGRGGMCEPVSRRLTVRVGKCNNTGYGSVRRVMNAHFSVNRDEHGNQYRTAVRDSHTSDDERGYYYSVLTEITSPKWQRATLWWCWLRGRYLFFPQSLSLSLDIRRSLRPTRVVYWWCEHHSSVTQREHKTTNDDNHTQNAPVRGRHWSSHTLHVYTTTVLLVAAVVVVACDNTTGGGGGGGGGNRGRRRSTTGGSGRSGTRYEHNRFRILSR